LSWPNSPSTTGTCCASGAIWLSQQDSLAQALKLYACHDAAMLSSGSVGRYVSHSRMSLVHSSPETISMFVAPVARTASTRSCMPAASYGRPVQAPPSRRHCHPNVLFHSAGISG
jgi:hypothetical protein